MAKSVVDCFELIQIKDHEGCHDFVSSALGKRKRYTFGDEATVWQAGQWVVHGKLSDDRFFIFQSLQSSSGIADIGEREAALLLIIADDGVKAISNAPNHNLAMFQSPALEDSVYHAIKPREISLGNKAAQAGSLEMRSPTEEHSGYGNICLQYPAFSIKRQIADRRKIVEIAVAFMFLPDFIISMLKSFVLHLKFYLVNRKFMQ